MNILGEWVFFFAQPDKNLIKCYKRSMSALENTMEVRQKFLAELSYTLFENLGFKERLTKAAEYSVHQFCDWCTVNILDENHKLLRTVVVHKELSQNENAKLLYANFPPFAQVPENTVVFNDLNEQALREHFVSEEELIILKSMGIRSYLIVPLHSRNTVIGTVAFVSKDGSFGAPEVFFAEEIAKYIGISAENSKLYEESQKAIRIRDEVLSVVSHDLKNPLAAIRLASQTLRRRYDSSTDHKMPPELIEKMLNAIDQSVVRSMTLIADLLDFSKAASGQMTIEARSIAVNDLLSESIEFLRPLADNRSVKLEWKPCSDDVSCDSKRVQQVFSNLVGNAIKFTQPGGSILIEVKQDKEQLVFSVQDTGPGIQASHINHLFELYWQAKETKDLGSGLGLPICKGIVEAHGGRIWAESTIGKGSTFYFTLPRAQLSS